MNEVNLIDNKFQVFDDIIPKENQDAIENTLLSSYFPWYYNNGTVDEESISDHKKLNPTFKVDFQLTHRIVWQGQIESDFFHVINDELLAPLEYDGRHVRRVKCNMQVNNNYEVKETGPHVDIDEPHYVGLYYVSDSDGDTVLYNDDMTKMARVSPKKGRMVFFRGDIMHTSSTPKEYRLRPVININLKNTFV
jgi:hypothetical protein